MKIKKSNIYTIILQLFCIIGLTLAYVFTISNNFSYMGFTYEFDIYKVLIIDFIFILFLLLSLFLKDRFIFVCWHLIFILFFVGEGIYFQYSIECNSVQLISVGIVLILLILISRQSMYFKPINIDTHGDIFLSFCSFVMIIPFIVYYYKYINLKNLLLIDVYETRALFRRVSRPLTGYLSAPLVRVILPVLILNKIEEKKFKQVLIYTSMILYVYLCGALKSVFLGVVALFLFYFGSYNKKINNFLFVIIFLTFVGTFLSLVFDNIFFIDSFVRRVFFTPAYLNTKYNNYFANQPTFMTHSGFYPGVDPFGKGLSFFMGENILGVTGLNANVGLFTEGYLSFGYVGLVLFAMLISLIIMFIKMTNIDSKYFGIVFVYIYYFNTSFLSTLLMTHGLLFFLLCCFFFLGKKREKGFVYE